MIHVQNGLLYASEMQFIRGLDEGETFAPHFSGTGIIIAHPERGLVWVFEQYGRVFQTRDLNADPRQMWLSYAFAWPFLRTPVRLQPETVARWYDPVFYEMDEIHLDDRAGPRRVTRRFVQFSDRTYEVTLNQKGRPSGWKLALAPDSWRRGWEGRKWRREERVRRAAEAAA